MSGTGIPHGATCLRACSAMSGAGVAYGTAGLRDVRIGSHYPCCADIAYARAAVDVEAIQCDVLAVNPAICLRERYAISGTDIAYVAISPRAPYGMPGTDIAYGAISLRASYAMPGTDIAYGAMPSRCTPLSPYAPRRRCPVLTERMVICLCVCCVPTRWLYNLRYCRSV
eukprot:2327690-Rhodomonas_salina.1